MATRATNAESGRPSSLKGDIIGGLACAVLTLPGAAGLGILALSPLGEQYVSHGILAGLYPAIFLPLTALILGARGGMMYSPRSVLAFLIASFALRSLASPRAGIADAADVPRTLSVLFLVIFAAGLFQAAFGAFRLGALVRYIPSPVMAGFQNAGAILIFFSQLDPMLGFARHVPLLELPGQLGAVQPMTLLVGLVTALAMWLSSRATPGVPPAAAGLIVGTAAYYAVVGLGLGHALGPVIGPLPVHVPAPSYLAGFAELLAEPGRWRLLAVVVSGALSLAIIASLDGLLTAKASEDVTGERTDGTRTLVYFGIGNMVVASFGGITGSANMVGTVASHRAGARTHVSVFVCALAILV
ncbi:MAG TPA: SulP family inorganic anion transporter, partial [Candidatus Methylomirabilis sp.]|nr:SulP family inorganic anion transporter [Candidatus Methylomirabilis sp.]